MYTPPNTATVSPVTATATSATRAAPAPAGRGREPATPPPRAVVVGGGICGLTAAWRLHEAAAAAGLALEVRVVEASSRPGGKVVTEHLDGFVVEGGPDSFLSAKPRAAALVRDLGLGDRLVGCADVPRRVWVVQRGRLVELPAGLKMLVPTRLVPFLASPLFSWRGKARILAERWLPARAEGGEAEGRDESLADFVRRRFGREALERLADPVTSSIHLGDPERLSLAAVWPAGVECERRFGSVTRGVTAGGRPAGAPGVAVRSAAEPPFLTLRGGLGELIDALAGRLAAAGAEVLTGRPALELRSGAEEPGGGGRPWTVRLAGGAELAADAVVLAVPAYAAAELLAGSRPELAAGLAALPYASAATVALGFDAADARLPDGFGFFVPAAERRAVVAAAFASTKFPGRAPGGRVLVRAFVGGARGERWAELPDGELVAAVRADLEALLGLAAEPVLARVHRWPRGYPQYEVGHRERVTALEAQCGPGLYLAGSAFHGAGLPDTVASAERAAAALAAHLAARAAASRLPREHRQSKP